MAQKGIMEYDAKLLLYKKLNSSKKLASVSCAAELLELSKKEAWLSGNLVVKADSLFNKRAKRGLIALNVSLLEAIEFINKNSEEIPLEGVKGRITSWLVEPYIPHEDEYYLSLRTNREFDEILFSHKGGVGVEENWHHVTSIQVPLDSDLSAEEFKELLSEVKESDKKEVKEFVSKILKVFREENIAFLEVNPFSVIENKAVVIGVVCKLDDCASFISDWKGMKFPNCFGTCENVFEKQVAKLDATTGASLKLSILNPNGRIWLLTAGGGASMVYVDTLVELGGGSEVANYAEYSGNPLRECTREYAKIIIDAMLSSKNSRYSLVLGGGIANFTDVKQTLSGIADAIKEKSVELKRRNVKVLVRRGGPNSSAGLAELRKTLEENSLPFELYDEKVELTKIVKPAIEWLDEDAAF